MKKSLTKQLLVGTVFMSASFPVVADDFADALKDGDASLSFRYRVESVDQDGIDRNALASTLRTILSYKTGKFNGFSGFVAFRDVRVIGDTTYNNTINGKGFYPVVADPADTDIEQGYINYAPNKNVSLTVGRKKLIWDNQRFISAVGWRQNHASFDTAMMEFTSNDKKLTGKYAYAWNVNRIFSEESPIGDFDSNVHLFNMGYKGWEYGKISTYAYLLDFNDAFGLRLSSKTFGGSLTGKIPLSNGLKVSYVGEYANQTDYGDNPDEYSENYFRGELGLVTNGGLSVQAGYEVLGGDGTASFKTPLALLHGYNGWADKFLATPGNGLEDKYIKASYAVKSDGPMKGTKIMAQYHDYDSHVNDVSYGSEFDIAISKPFAKRYSVVLKGAFYNADDFSVDTTKLWFMLAAKF